MRELFEYLPATLRAQLTLDRDSHGNVKVSQIETEKFLIECVQKELETLKKEDKYHGAYNPLSHFFGYEGRCGLPSCFDTNYCYALGYNAAILVHEGLTGMSLSRSPSRRVAPAWRRWERCHRPFLCGASGAGLPAAKGEEQQSYRSLSRLDVLHLQPQQAR